MDETWIELHISHAGLFAVSVANIYYNPYMELYEARPGDTSMLIMTIDFDKSYQMKQSSNLVGNVFITDIENSLAGLLQST